ncbi:uncharacterized protein SCHCODRAFT_01088086 [Schizophyllum commune H4-8]|uniref:Uncharacterized protein n=1 Tax=Schizophyllum commune (strain H4-8 / FGSC 9210) TaxID=578458 RepID=D8Q1H9_SCHCM|nr:uncharacterized protein SCHCODRAFT_01088086 [Schizophyllum commune H4-8]KAI5895432.1 hypothetical protein SCHCODRAFT_01088086 [Schizophyllum commune H4-8]
MTNSWRALARMARDRLVAADPEDLTLVLGLWYLRLSALARLRLFNQTAAECTNLFNVLDAVDPPSARAWLMDRILPFELEVMRARLRYWAGDPMGYTDALAGLLNKCKVKARLTSRRDEASIEMWKERGARIALILASQMVETKDFTAATRLLEPLAKSAPLRSAVGRIYLQAGDLAAAGRHFRAVADDEEADEAQKETNEAVMAAAKGEWAKADEVLRGLLEREQDNYSAINNLAVAMLAQGKLKDAIAVLEKALHAAPATIAVAEPFLFNLSTLYELRSASAVNNKRELLITVARFSGDGLRTTCLKMPTS